MTDDPSKKAGEDNRTALAEKREGIAKVRAEWVKAHGSERLKKALRLGLLGQSIGVYKDERLKLESPGYVWKAPEWRISPIINPSEEALDLLAMELERFPEDAHLASVHRGDGIWLQAVVVDWPFADDDDISGTAVLFVNKGDVAKRKLARGGL